MGLKILLNPWLPGLLLALAAVPVAQGVVQMRTGQIWNQRITAHAVLGLPEAGQPPEALLARAAALDEKGDFEAALNLYKRLEEQPGHPYARLAAYNAATIYLRRAVAAGGPSADPQTIPLIELAKESYRNLLRQDPDQWDARYNLDRALRVIPEEDDEDAGGGNPPIGAERAPTTMRGFTLGLP